MTTLRSLLEKGVGGVGNKFFDETALLGAGKHLSGRTHTHARAHTEV